MFQLPSISPALRSRLKAEIQKWGIFPVIVDEFDNVLDGLLRMELAKELGIKDVERVTVYGLTPAEKQNLRFVMNACRRHLTQEQVRAWIAWELQVNPNVSDRSIGSVVGASHTTVGAVRKESTGQSGQLDNPRIGLDGKSRKPPQQVLTSTERQRLEVQTHLQNLDEVPTGNLTPRKLRSARWQQNRAEEIASAKPVTLKDFAIHACDFRNVGERIASGSVGLAICDPVWPDWQTLGKALGDTLCRILRPNGLCCVYTGAIFMDEWNDALKSCGLKKEGLVIALHKQPGSITSNTGLRHLYSQILLYRNQPSGELRLPGVLADIMGPCKLDKRYHPYQQPVGESVHLIKALSRPGDLISDLTSGSGTVAVATAIVGQGRRFVGCEIDPDYVRIGMDRVARVLDAGYTNDEV
jgi:hypothetical protein